MNKQHKREQLITSSLKNNYDIVVANITPLALGADADALIYKIQAPNQTTYFVKLKRGRGDSSAKLQLLLHDAGGIKEVICPIKTIDNQPQVYVQDSTLTVYPFIDGQDGFSQPLTDDQWIMLGKTLKQIHQFQVPTSISMIIKQEDYSAKWRNLVKSVYENNQQVASPDEVATTFLVSLERHRSVILQLIDKAETLAKVIPKRPANFVLCHGDIHAGNVLMTEAGALYIVDCDQPIMAPKERDLMFIGGGVGNVWNNKREVELFYTGYGETEVNQTLIDYYRCERIVQDVAEFYQQLLSDNLEKQDRLASYNHFIAMFKPNGVVDIALKNFALL